MKKLLIVAAGACFAAQLSLASPVCVSGSLASYIALGAGGCMIGNDTLNLFHTDAGITGATQISPQNVTITPSGSTANPGFTALVNAMANGGMLFETIFTFQIAGNSFTADRITLSGATISGDGAVTDIQDFCRGGVFGSDGVTGCTGVHGTLLALDQGSDQATFSSAAFLSVTNDFTIDGGSFGSTSAGTITNQFTAAASAVPEPATWSLTCIALLAAGYRRFRRS